MFYLMPLLKITTAEVSEIYLSQTSTFTNEMLSDDDEDDYDGGSHKGV